MLKAASRSARSRLTLASGTVHDFMERSLARARKLDSGEPVTREFTITFEDPGDLLRVLSAERLRVLRAVCPGPRPLADIARSLGRDRKAVSRDVGLLESFGLVSTRREINPGHGRLSIVESRAARYRLLATI